MGIDDNLDEVWQRFYQNRNSTLFERFPGRYRAVVVETNDPLQVYRVRFKCPEMHNYELKSEECPWAAPSHSFGGKNAGSWEHPIIGDIVWIDFEKQHPYGPVWCGSADATRRRCYPLESIYTESPTAVDEHGNSDEKPEDWDVQERDYLAKDLRPMSTGWRDRLGNYEANRSVGFFPIEHDSKPAPNGIDGVNQAEFELTSEKPKVNEPDMKYMVRQSKYGHYTIMSDVGYYWHNDPKEDPDVGEIQGRFKKDIDFEIKRYKFYTKHFNEQEPKSEDRDQRRIEFRTRAGHMFEMRDVGYAQLDGGLSGKTKIKNVHARDDFKIEEGDSEEDTGDGKDTKKNPKILSKWEKSDGRWLKIRTKGGHVLQFMDAGFHPIEDEFYKRNLEKEIGADEDFDHEEQDEWTKRDARQVRIVTRHGIKFVLDDRGSDTKKAEENPNPKGNGFLLKTRRGWDQDDTENLTGFGFEANDKPELNRALLYSPKSKIIEINDEYDYMMMCTNTSELVPEEWQKLKENEFALGVAMSHKPEQNTYHMKLDNHNGYVRFKTAAGNDNAESQRRPLPHDYPEAPDDHLKIQQGFEARDGRFPKNDVWAEMVDCRDRGFFLSETDKAGIWRSAGPTHKMWIALALDDDKNHMLVRNDGELIHIYSGQDIKIHSARDIEFSAGRNINLTAGNVIEIGAKNDIAIESKRSQVTTKARSKVVAQVPGNSYDLTPADFTTKLKVNCEECTGFLPGAAPGGGAQAGTGGFAPANPTFAAEVTIPEVERMKPEQRGDEGADDVTKDIEKVDIEKVKDTNGPGEQDHEPLDGGREKGSGDEGDEE